MKTVHVKSLVSVKCKAMLVPSSATVITDGWWEVAVVDDEAGSVLGRAYPLLKYALSELIRAQGNIVGVLTLKHPNPVLNKENHREVPYYLVNFPVKPGTVFLDEDGAESIQVRHQRHVRTGTKGQRLPGFMSRVRLGIVEESVKELRTLVDKRRWRRVAIPAFGDSSVNTYLLGELDDRYTLVFGECDEQSHPAEPRVEHCTQTEGYSLLPTSMPNWRL